MRRGFKAQSERRALELREQLELQAHEALNPRRFLESLGFIVWFPEDIPGLSSEHVQQLTEVDPDSWSGVTIREEPHVAIIVNSSHSAKRQANTMMHEWAHIDLRHKPNRVDRSDNDLFLLSDYPQEIEDEADWLAGAVLLPRDGLLYHRQRGLAAQAIAQHHGVSLELANWRLRMTGIDRQLRNRSR